MASKNGGTWDVSVNKNSPETGIYRDLTTKIPVNGRWPLKAGSTVIVFLLTYLKGSLGFLCVEARLTSGAKLPTETELGWTKSVLLL